jgi:NAD(P)-dependent dehydrogenase (short-subunit alcohol dehydrogenase family)
MSLHGKIAFVSGASRPLGYGGVIGRPSDLQEIADVVAFLASVEAKVYDGRCDEYVGWS